ncbi:beta-1,3-galactosyltransferas-like protein-6 [Tribonema minus]|uniref:Hexosyltransferase n=1 Tax=Tribonema minus TaxID=303371 RepID=A0A835YVE3_9STRA|nr:beta-1,3-galactosyltransferas-like protein-6 [Tribonema minus]
MLGVRRSQGRRFAAARWLERAVMVLLGEAAAPGGASAVVAKPALPYVDLAIAVLIRGDEEEELKRVRRIYWRYPNATVTTSVGSWSFRKYFVVADPNAPPEGTLTGEFFRVNVPNGYDRLADKTLATMALRHHLDFRFLVKTDADTYPCLQRVIETLHARGVAREPRLYAGLLNRCGKLFPAGHKLHDAQFQAATGGVVPCHPMYHQGAFYILGRALVEHLDRSRDDLQVMSNEDAMVGLWLLGARRVLVDIGGDFHCACFTKPRGEPGNDLPFYHFCKSEDKVAACLRKFGAC